MPDSPPIPPQLPPRRLAGGLCLRWLGSVLLLGGGLVLGWDVLACFTRGTRWHFALTCLADVLPPLSQINVVPPWNRLIEGVLEFSALIPLSLLLCGLGWWARTLAPGTPGSDRVTGQASRNAEE